MGDDVAWLQNDTDLNDSPFKITDEQKPENTFRIFSMTGAMHQSPSWRELLMMWSYRAR